jgi:hypothetical protein
MQKTHATAGNGEKSRHVGEAESSAKPFNYRKEGIPMPGAMMPVNPFAIRSVNCGGCTLTLEFHSGLIGGRYPLRP